MNGLLYDLTGLEAVNVTAKLVHKEFRMREPEMTNNEQDQATLLSAMLEACNSMTS